MEVTRPHAPRGAGDDRSGVEVLGIRIRLASCERRRAGREGGRARAHAGDRRARAWGGLRFGEPGDGELGPVGAKAYSDVRQARDRLMVARTGVGVGEQLHLYLSLIHI